jgi:SAM-dependent methyltransferase
MSSVRCVCGGTSLAVRHVYNAPPKGEIRFEFSSKSGYHREILQCKACGHFLSIHEMDISRLYEGDYVSSNYGEKGILETFNKINHLPPEKSDNVGRARRINEYADSIKSGRKVLDVGSGLCVFLYRMKAAGWDCTALDPDERSARHAKEVVGVDAICGDFMKLDVSDRFDLITFNRVLEHVRDPVAMLVKAKKLLLPKGWIYVEVPDGESASKDSFEREEFFIDHLHIFSEQSLAAVVSKAGFQVKVSERLREPSSKYTLRAFIVPV